MLDKLLKIDQDIALLETASPLTQNSANVTKIKNRLFVKGIAKGFIQALPIVVVGVVITVTVNVLLASASIDE